MKRFTMFTPSSTTLVTAAETAWLAPPRPTTDRGQPRRIGVELEFAGLTAPETAEHVRDLFGGRVETVSDFQVHVRETELGDFLVELDLRYLHGGDPDDPIRKVLGEMAATVVPMEIACPPVEIGDGPRLDLLRRRLSEAGALGTHSNPLYALGMQLNPELARLDVGHVLAMLRSFLLLRDWLRAEIGVDPSRRLLFFAAGFPPAYCELVLDRGYAPSMPTLIDDYLRLNPTRNRELDLLPLFRHLDEDRVMAALPKEKINARPTFHYRLPNALIDDPGWSIAEEWNRWVMVERLAERPDRIDEFAALWRQERDASVLAVDWTPWAQALRNTLGEDP